MADVTLTESEKRLLHDASFDWKMNSTWAAVEAIVTERVAAALGEVEAALADVYEIEWAQYGRRSGKAAIRIVREVRGEVGG